MTRFCHDGRPVGSEIKKNSHLLPPKVKDYQYGGSSIRLCCSKLSLVLTQALWQEVLDELGVISNMQNAVDSGVHQFLLLVAQILADVLRDKHYVALHVDHKKEAVQCLRGEDKEGGQRRETRLLDRQKRWKVERRKWKFTKKKEG